MLFDSYIRFDRIWRFIAKTMQGYKRRENIFFHFLLSFNKANTGNAIARAILGPKKSLPPLKVKIFIAHPFKWAALWVFPHKNNYIPQHLNNRCINSYIMSQLTMAGIKYWDICILLSIMYTSLHNVYFSPNAKD